MSTAIATANAARFQTNADRVAFVRREQEALRLVRHIEAAVQIDKDLPWIGKKIAKAIKKNEDAVCLYRWSKMPCDPAAYAEVLQRRLDELVPDFCVVEIVLANGGWTPFVHFAVEVSW